jgi:hypothetical protein
MATTQQLTTSTTRELQNGLLDYEMRGYTLGFLNKPRPPIIGTIATHALTDIQIYEETPVKDRKQ